MPGGVFNRLFITREPGINERKAGARFDGVLINIVQPPRPRRPLQFGVKQRQHQQTEPENRHRVAEQRKGAHRQIPRRADVAGAKNACDNARQRADNQRQRSQFEGGRESGKQVVQHRLAG